MRILKYAVFLLSFWAATSAVPAGAAAVDASRGAPASIFAREDWMGIYMGGSKVGYSMTRVEKTADGYSLTEEMLTELDVLGTKQEIRTTTHSNIDESLVLKGFDFSLKSGVADTEVKGVVKGSVLDLDVNTAGRSRRQEMQLSEPPHLDSDIELYLLRQGLEVGKKFRLLLFDPATLSPLDMVVEIEAKEDLKIGDRLLPVYRVREDFAGVTTRTWISPELGVMKGEGPMGFMFLRETKEEAQKPPAGGYGQVDIIAMVSIPAGGVPVPQPRKAVYLKARLSGADLVGLELSGAGQTFEGGVISVSKDSLEGLKPAALPINDPTLAEFLKPEPYVQSDDPAIIAKAKEVVGTDIDSLQAAKKLADWVYKSVEKKPSAGIPSAVEVLKDLSGDCNEHTVLYTALARAVGIPTRMDAGLVMMDGSFFYHAWPEVYVGKWISIDPTFGQFPADATHIRLVTGGPDKQINILKVVGKLKAEVLESR